MKIAVIGSGIAGLSACWYLGKEHNVTLIERQPLVGMDAQGTNIETESSTVRVDVPFRAFKKNYYPCLLELYKEAGIEIKPIDYSFSLSYDDGKTYFGFSTIGIGGNFFPLAQPECFTSSDSRRIFFDAIRFYSKSAEQLDQLKGEQLTILEFLRRFQYSEKFALEYLLPMFATINTCSLESAGNYPAEAVIDYHSKGFRFLRFFSHAKGTTDVTTRLSKRAREVRLNSDPKRLVLSGDKVRVLYGDGEESFDRIVLAAPANQAITMLPDEFRREKEILRSIRYESSEVVTHTDESFMPAKKRNWAPLCFSLSAAKDSASATLRLNKLLSSIGKREIFQTWNPTREIRQGSLISRSRFERPVINLECKRALTEFHELQEQPNRKIWLCGSYARYGIPLLEAGVATALDVQKWLNHSVLV
ncbi:NAD/FAD-binding protein [Leptospira perolatii]|uniref:NAD/FAD-binding protein n=1 Tax=Leptospira perolatii TaxID=2023191 RepID=A0A2M9ZS78_9LEPT|nr:FAD-dependent oxidoreductase [Leptospira perolatii]PJZ71392.1 NAD/FAD-binding protein [Leptospira perolatii]PJZ74926.1 NAD/FAD-binding protein [Leptospira perolatii]